MKMANELKIGDVVDARGIITTPPFNAYDGSREECLFARVQFGVNVPSEDIPVAALRPVSLFTEDERIQISKYAEVLSEFVDDNEKYIIGPLSPKIESWIKKEITYVVFVRLIVRALRHSVGALHLET